MVEKFERFNNRKKTIVQKAKQRSRIYLKLRARELLKKAKELAKTASALRQQIEEMNLRYRGIKVVDKKIPLQKPKRQPTKREQMLINEYVKVADKLLHRITALRERAYTLLEMAKKLK